MNLAFDRFVEGRPYPNLAPLIDISNGYSSLGLNSPYIVPCRLLYYSEDHGWPVDIYSVESAPLGSYYPVGIGWFSHDIDYFGLFRPTTLDLVRTGQLRVLFYYHEGDNPYLEQIRLNQLCELHGLPEDCYRFVSGNTQADELTNFVYFPDHELFYWRANRSSPPVPIHTGARSRTFTLLCRLHKWWRATVVALLHREGLLDSAYWSYNGVEMGDLPEDNPLRVEVFPGLADTMQEFLAGVPYRCDDLTTTEQNLHHTLVDYHYRDAYCNIVLETHYDADSTQGTFLTEKTFKPIKHGQPFVVVGPAGTLAQLRRLGYRTFDSAIDGSYDAVTNNTERFRTIVNTLRRIARQAGPEWSEQCLADCQHNQQLFQASKLDRLNNLEKRLQ